MAEEQEYVLRWVIVECKSPPKQRCVAAHRRLQDSECISLVTAHRTRPWQINFLTEQLESPSSLHVLQLDTSLEMRRCHSTNDSRLQHQQIRNHAMQLCMAAAWLSKSPQVRY